MTIVLCANASCHSADGSINAREYTISRENGSTRLVAAQHRTKKVKTNEFAADECTQSSQFDVRVGTRFFFLSTTQ